MTTFERFEGDLPMLLEELAPPRTPDYLDSVFGRTSGSRQRPAWSFPERWLPMSTLTDRMATTLRVPWRPILILALLLLAFAAAALYVGTQQRRLPAPFGPAANGLIPYGSAGDIYLGDPLTGTKRLLVGGPGNDSLVGFSPDGTRIAFVRPVGSGAGDLPVDVYVVNADGSDPHPVTTKPIGGLSRISWTPDGRLAVIHPVEARSQSASAPGAQVIGLDILDTDGSGKLEPIATADAMDVVQFRPPDGREILIKGQINGFYGLYAMNADGTNVHSLLLATDPESDEFWGGVAYAADGDRIFYTRPFEHESTTGTCCTLWVMNADGSDPHEFIPSTGESWDGQPTVSPDGTRVAFWNGQVSVVPADGTGRAIPTGPALSGNRHWVWAPDSSKILMYLDDGSSTTAYLLDPNGGPGTTVPWQQDGDLDWQRVAPAP
ncbi:MAG TPA: hypothetical protein VIF44_02360 [Candidatus Limnocylindrales bacterium]|jgi:dipeptidyl aminopeptidase/acylaminoacyl peptidase